MIEREVGGRERERREGGREREGERERDEEVAGSTFQSWVNKPLKGPTDFLFISAGRRRRQTVVTEVSNQTL